MNARWHIASLRLLLAFLALPAGCAGQTVDDSGFGPVPVGMTVLSSEEYYDVTGYTAAELRQAMRAAGPLDDGRRWDGRTHWNVRWRFRYAMRTGVCRMTDVTVVYTSVITLPRWNAPPRAAPTLVREWDHFVRTLRIHEEGHRNIGAEAARETLRRIRNVQSVQCGDMSAQARALGHRTLDEYRALQAEYDAKTRHGRTQGVSWPARQPP